MKALFLLLILTATHSGLFAQKSPRWEVEDRYDWEIRQSIWTMWENGGRLDSLIAVQTQRDKDIRKQARIVRDSVFDVEDRLRMVNHYDREGRMWQREDFHFFAFADVSEPYSILQYEYHPESDQVSVQREINHPDNAWNRDTLLTHYDTQGNVISVKYPYEQRKDKDGPVVADDKGMIRDKDGRLISQASYGMLSEDNADDTLYLHQYLFDAEGRLWFELEVDQEEIRETARSYDKAGNPLQIMTVSRKFKGKYPLIYDSTGQRLAYRSFPRYMEWQQGRWQVKLERDLFVQERREYQNGKLRRIYVRNPLTGKETLTDHCVYDPQSGRLRFHTVYERFKFTTDARKPGVHAWEYDSLGRTISKWHCVGVDVLEKIFWQGSWADVIRNLGEIGPFGFSLSEFKVDFRNMVYDQAGNLIEWQQDQYSLYGSREYQRLRFFADGRLREKVKRDDRVTKTEKCFYDEDKLLLRAVFEEQIANVPGYDQKMEMRRSYVRE